MDCAFARTIGKITENIIKLVYYLKSGKYSKYYYKYFENVKNLIEDFKGLNYLRFASFSYIPLFGWILPLVMRKNNPVCSFHAKQGFFLSLIFVFITIFLNIINMFSPNEWREFRLVLVFFIYIFYFIYILFCFIAFRAVLKGKPFILAFIKNVVDSVDL